MPDTFGLPDSTNQLILTPLQDSNPIPPNLVTGGNPQVGLDANSPGQSVGGPGSGVKKFSSALGNWLAKLLKAIDAKFTALLATPDASIFEVSVPVAVPAPVSLATAPNTRILVVEAALDANPAGGAVIPIDLTNVPSNVQRLIVIASIVGLGAPDPLVAPITASVAVASGTPYPGSYASPARGDSYDAAGVYPFDKPTAGGGYYNTIIFEWQKFNFGDPNGEVYVPVGQGVYSIPAPAP